MHYHYSITWSCYACSYYRLSSLSSYLLAAAFSVIINLFIRVWGWNPLPLARGRFRTAFKILTNRFPVIYIRTISGRGSLAKQRRRGGVKKRTIKKMKKSSDLSRRLWQILVRIEGHNVYILYTLCIRSVHRHDGSAGGFLDFIYDVNIASVCIQGH